MLTALAAILGGVAAPSMARSLAPGSLGSALAGPLASCPSAPNVTADSVTILTTGDVGPAPFTTTLCGYSGSPYASQHWSFGDGTPSSTGTNLSSTENSVSHTFTASGAYLVWFNTSYADGNSANSSVWVYATGAAPISLTLDLTVTPHNGSVPLKVTVTPNIQGCRGVCDWNVTYSSGSSTFVTPGSPGFPWVPINLDASGTWTIVANATDPLGDFGESAPAYVSATGSLPGNNSTSSLSVQFGGAVLRGSVPFQTNLTVSATGGFAPYSLEVCPGDGACAPEVQNWSGMPLSEPFTYDVAGNFTATATVTDSHGNQAVGTLPIVATSGLPLNVTVLASALTGPAPLPVGFLATVTGGTSPYTIQWTWGDGTVGSSTNGGIVAHLYVAAGTYKPSLTVRDSSGASLTVSVGTVNATSGLSGASHPSSGFLPGGSGGMDLLTYLAVAVVAAIVSGVGLGLLLRKRRRTQDANRLARALETQATAGREPTGTPTEGQR